MQIKKIEIKEKFSKFKNTSDKYTDIYLSREIKEISTWRDRRIGRGCSYYHPT